MTMVETHHFKVPPGLESDGDYEKLGIGITVDHFYPPDDIAAFRAHGLTNDAIMQLTPEQEHALLNGGDEYIRDTLEPFVVEDDDPELVNPPSFKFTDEAIARVRASLPKAKEAELEPATTPATAKAEPDPALTGAQIAQLTRDEGEGPESELVTNPPAPKSDPATIATEVRPEPNPERVPTTLEPLAAVLAAWKNAFGVGQLGTLNQAIELARHCADLNAALLAVAPMDDGTTISNVLLARWLRNHNEVPVEGLMLSGGGVDESGSPWWTLVPAELATNPPELDLTPNETTADGAAAPITDSDKPANDPFKVARGLEPEGKYEKLGEGTKSSREPRARATAQELLNSNGIYLKNYNLGNHASTCPKCSHDRKKKKTKCLSVKIDNDGACWHCNHCEWSGPEKGQRRTNDRPTPATDEVAQQEPISTAETSEIPSNFVAIYDYPGFQKVRFPKGHEPRFLIRHPDPSSNRAGKGWNWGAGGADTTVLYRKDEVDEAIANGYEIACVEGEKDANRLWSIGIPATCNVHGASKPGQEPKWTIEHSKQFAGAPIVVLGDHDAAGYAHQDVTCRISLGIAKRVRILKLADHWSEIEEGNDVSDWLDAGHTREQLDALIEQAPDYASQLPNDGTAFGYSWHLTWHGETDPTDTRKALVQDLLPEIGVALISGQWGTYKTFIANDLCAAVMTQTTFANKQVMRKGGVLFIACEGQGEVDIRLTAAFRKHGGIGNAPFAWVQGCPRLLDPNASKILTAMVKHANIKMMQNFGLPVVMVIIDTAGKAAGLSKQGELNDDAIAKMIMSRLADASTQTGALFVGVAHFGKNIETGTKGSSGFEDDADAVLAALGERGVNGTVPNPVMCARKRRSGPNGEEFSFQTEEAEVGSEKTLTIRWAKTDAAAPPKSKKKDNPWAAKSLRHLYQTIINVLVDHSSQQRPYPNGPTVKAVNLEIVRTEFHKTYPATGDEAGKREVRKKAFTRAIGTGRS